MQEVVVLRDDVTSHFLEADLHSLASSVLLHVCSSRSRSRSSRSCMGCCCCSSCCCCCSLSFRSGSRRSCSIGLWPCICRSIHLLFVCAVAAFTKLSGARRHNTLCRLGSGFGKQRLLEFVEDRQRLLVAGFIITKSCFLLFHVAIFVVSHPIEFAWTMRRYCSIKPAHDDSASIKSSNLPDAWASTGLGVCFAEGLLPIATPQHCVAKSVTIFGVNL
mmetsp:Transcript_90139/g.188478  ORF Transcript_90139/g.188478 Transcript_90139/m.188478 type:complete len:218 (+) Transcript_90139:750-1403(+)